MTAHGLARSGRLVLVVLVVLFGGGTGAWGQTPSPQGAEIEHQPVVRLVVQGPIIPIVATYLDRGLAEAEAAQAICVLQMDTPGGLVSTMQTMVQRILEARVPVVVYVAPRGAWAGSAGVFIAYAAHVSAMAPGTNIGAAHPVSVGLPGGPEPEKKPGEKSPGRDYAAEKSEHHLASYIRSIAQQRGRNEKWAEDAVRRSVSLTVSEAVARKVVDLEAGDLGDLLRRIEGRRVVAGGRTWVLHPRPGPVREIPMTGSERFLFTVCTPGVAAFLVMLGLYGMIYEFLQPGAVLPGVVGAICLLLGLYAMGQLPINYAGLALLLFSVLLFVGDLKFATHGALSIGGIISMVLGAILLVPAGHPYLAISWATLAAMVGVVGGGFLFLAYLVARSLRGTTLTGPRAMLGTVGEALVDLAPDGRIRVLGEIWAARTIGGAIPRGAPVKVVEVHDFVLHVEPSPDARPGPGENRV